MNDTQVEPGFAQALAADEEFIRQIDAGQALDSSSVYNAVRGQYPDGHQSAERRMRLADSIGGVTEGDLGAGHSRGYYRTRNGGAKEVFANAWSAIVDGDETFARWFPNAVEYIKRRYGL